MPKSCCRKPTAGCTRVNAFAKSLRSWQVRRFPLRVGRRSLPRLRLRRRDARADAGPRVALVSRREAFAGRLGAGFLNLIAVVLIGGFAAAALVRFSPGFDIDENS